MSTVRRICLATAFLALSVWGCDSEQPLQPSIEAAMQAGRGSIPAAPSNANAVAASYSLINVSWQDNSTNETGFEVHRSTTGPSGTFSLVASTGAGATSYGNSGLTASTQYCYTIRAFRTTGNKTSYSAFSGAACATTLLPPVPAAASNVNAAPEYVGSAIRLTWTDNSGDETGFRVERSATNNGPWATLGTTWANAVMFIDWQPPAPDQLAYFRVFAVNGFGDSPSSNVDSTAIPAAPSGVGATATGSDVALSWTDNSSVEDGFEVLRNSVVVATLSANTTAYPDAGLADGTYYYRVRATKDGGTSRESDQASVMVVTTRPAAPAGLDVVPSSSSSVDIRWLDNSTNEAGFHVERSSDGGWVATVGADETYVSIWGLQTEQQVCYRVVAFNGLGDSDPSNSDCATPPAAPTGLQAAPAAETGAIDLTWVDNSGVEDGFAVLRQDVYWDWYCDDSGCYYQPYYYYYQIGTVGTNVTSYPDAGLASGESYTYVVVALKDGGQSDYSNEATATAP